MRYVWITGAAAALLLGWLAWELAPLSPGALALQFTYTPRSFGAIVHFWSPADLARYRAHFPADFVLLACYGAFGWLLVRHAQAFRGYPRGGRRAVQWLLPLAAACDAAENLLHLWLTEAPRFGVPPAYAAAGACATLKWLLVLAFALAVTHALARAARPAAPA